MRDPVIGGRREERLQYVDKVQEALGQTYQADWGIIFFLTPAPPAPRLSRHKKSCKALIASKLWKNRAGRKEITKVEVRKRDGAS
jgi:hypothetical protein